MLTGTIENNVLTVKIPFDKKGVPSKSGKTTIHASSRGNQTVSVKGFDKPLTIGVNVYSA